MKENMITSIISIGISIVITVLCLFFMSFLIYKFHLPQKPLEALITVTYMISCFTGGLLAARNREKKYVRGFIIGSLYVGIITICSLIHRGNMSFMQDSRTFIISTICMASATLGGMLA